MLQVKEWGGGGRGDKLIQKDKQMEAGKAVGERWMTKEMLVWPAKHEPSPLTCCRG